MARRHVGLPDHEAPLEGAGGGVGLTVRQAPAAAAVVEVPLDFRAVEILVLGPAHELRHEQDAHGRQGVAGGHPQLEDGLVDGRRRKPVFPIARGGDGGQYDDE